MDIYEALHTTRAMRWLKPDRVPEEVIGRMMPVSARQRVAVHRTRVCLTVTDPVRKPLEKVV